MRNMVADAVASLRPGTQWSMSGNDLTTLVWHTEGVVPVTQAEVDAEIARLEAEQQAKEAEQQAKRAASLAKLEALGLTTDDLAVLGFGA